jgi:hypothetical protein
MTTFIMTSVGAGILFTTLLFISLWKNNRKEFPDSYIHPSFLLISSVMPLIASFIYAYVTLKNPVVFTPETQSNGYVIGYLLAGVLAQWGAGVFLSIPILFFCLVKGTKHQVSHIWVACTSIVAVLSMLISIKLFISYLFK